MVKTYNEVRKLKKRKLKTYVIPGFLTILMIGVMSGTMILKTNENNKLKDAKNHTYVSNTIIEQDVPVINTSTKIINPYTDASVTIGKNYYDYKADKNVQEKSIIYHNDTYMQNSGIDFVSTNVFDVISVLDGTVSDVKEDETLGKIVEIKHDNNYISIYQSLSDVSVKKGDTVKQGQVIGKSGTNELDKEIGNHLHFEFYVNGQIVDPTLYLDKEITKDNN